jgi:hypothetical protein
VIDTISILRRRLFYGKGKMMPTTALRLADYMNEAADRALKLEINITVLPGNFLVLKAVWDRQDPIFEARQLVSFKNACDVHTNILLDAVEKVNAEVTAYEQVHQR